MRSPFLLLVILPSATWACMALAHHAAEVRAAAEIARAGAATAAPAVSTRLPQPAGKAGPTWTSDPTWRAFAARRSGSRIFAGWSPDRTPRVVAIDPSTGKWETASTVGSGDARVSPDGQALAVGQVGDFWVLTPDGAAWRLFDGPGLHAWGPDSRQFSLGDGRRYRIDGSPLPPLPHDVGAIRDWSPDGRWLLYCSDRTYSIDPRHGGNHQLYLVSVDGREERQLTFSGYNLFARFSPDSRQVVYTHTETRLPGIRETPGLRYGASSIWVVGIDGKNARRVLPQPGPIVDMRACWSPDGKRLAVAMNRDVYGRVRRIQIVDLNGRVERTFDLPGYSWVPELDWN
jgi:WD40 repeat protein